MTFSNSLFENTGKEGCAFGVGTLSLSGGNSFSGGFSLGQGEAELIGGATNVNSNAALGAGTLTLGEAVFSAT